MTPVILSKHVAKETWTIQVIRLWRGDEDEIVHRRCDNVIQTPKVRETTLMKTLGLTAIRRPIRQQTTRVVTTAAIGTDVWGSTLMFVSQIWRYRRQTDSNPLYLAYEGPTRKSPVSCERPIPSALNVCNMEMTTLITVAPPADPTPALKIRLNGYPAGLAMAASTSYMQNRFAVRAPKPRSPLISMLIITVWGTIVAALWISSDIYWKGQLWRFLKPLDEEVERNISHVKCPVKSCGQNQIKPKRGANEHWRRK